MLNSLQKNINERNVIKVISGINNFQSTQIIKICKAADIAQATYLDIAANPHLINTVKQVTKLPLCISTLNPNLIYECLSAGAEIIELGNYDAFYKSQNLFSEKRVFSISKLIKSLFPEITICVTIPHHLSVKKQVYLAQQLEDLNIDMCAICF